MSTGCACISFDCDAGPSELITDEVTGYLIKEGVHQDYINRLRNLMDSEDLRLKFSLNGIKKMKNYDENKIARDYFNYISNSIDN